jgi:hypothetical protein
MEATEADPASILIELAGHFALPTAVADDGPSTRGSRRSEDLDQQIFDSVCGRLRHRDLPNIPDINKIGVSMEVNQSQQTWEHMLGILSLTVIIGQRVEHGRCR